MRRRLRAPSPALVISLIALFVALGGTSYAAITLPKNSVGTKQIKNNAVTASKIKNGTVPNATKLGGVAAASYTAGAVLPSGQTMTGSWGDYEAPNNGSEFFSVTSFPHPLPAALDGAHVIYVSGSSATHCSGPGQADAGYLCVYQLAAQNASPGIGVQKITAGPGASVNGFVVVVTPSAAGSSYLTGTWAVTAP